MYINDLMLFNNSMYFNNVIKFSGTSSKAVLSHEDLLFITKYILLHFQFLFPNYRDLHCFLASSLVFLNLDLFS